MGIALVEPTPAEPDPQGLGSGRLRQIVAYGREVYDLRERLGRVRDERKAPKTDAPEVAAALFFTGLLRIRSFNALEPKLSEKPFFGLWVRCRNSRGFARQTRSGAP